MSISLWFCGLRETFHSRTPSVLQLIGASPTTSRLPIQVYHAPCGVLGTLRQWFMRSLSDNPVDLIFALYDMVGIFSICQKRTWLTFHSLLARLLLGENHPFL